MDTHCAKFVMIEGIKMAKIFSAHTALQWSIAMIHSISCFRKSGRKFAGISIGSQMSWKLGSEHAANLKKTII